MRNQSSRPKRLTTLTPFEDKCWVFAFCSYVDEGRSDLQADHLAWRDMQLDFPRLRQYDGCRP